jgi:uncharacterized protein
MEMKMMMEGGKAKSEDASRGPALNTFGGRDFYPLRPSADEVSLIEIAHALGTTSRYTGHCLFYSVAEHSVLVSHMVPEQDAMAGLMHDAPEAYLADLSRPVKRALGRHNSYFQIEEDVWFVIAERFGISEELPKSVKEADLAICGLEREVLHPDAPEWDIPFPIPRNITIHALPPHAAPYAFLRRYCDLTGENFSAYASDYGYMVHKRKQAIRDHVKGKA